MTTKQREGEIQEISCAQDALDNIRPPAINTKFNFMQPRLLSCLQTATVDSVVT